jgi:hypothetical protein
VVEVTGLSSNLPGTDTTVIAGDEICTGTALDEEAADEPMARKHLQIRPIARASISRIDSVPQNRTLVLKSIENFFEEDGRYTIEVLHQTPFGVDMLERHPLNIEKILRIRGTVRSSE